MDNEMIEKHIKLHMELMIMAILFMISSYVSVQVRVSDF